MAIITLNLIFLLLFLFKYYNKLKKEIEKIKNNILNNIRVNNTLNQKKKSLLNHIKQIKETQNTKNVKSSQRKIKLNKINNNNKYKNKHSPPKINNKFNINNNNNINSNNNNKNVNNNINKNRKTFSVQKPPKNTKNENNTIKTNNNKLILSTNSKNNIINNNNKTLMKKGPKIKLNISELNSLTFPEALTKDKRTFLEYYFSLLKSNHPLLYIFNYDDYNSQIIKYSIFFFNISSYIAVNALFYNDSTMHKIYTDHGSYNFVYQLPQIIYSTIISGILKGIIKVLGLSEKNILKLKKINTALNNINKETNALFRKLKIKFFLFYAIIFILLPMFWYYVTCFCGIYRNTQIHLIKDSLCSFTTSLLTPFAIYLFTGFFRILGLKKKSKLLYGFSKILQIF